MQEFTKGFLAGIALMLLLAFFWALIMDVKENQGYKDKLVIEYHTPSGEGNKDLIIDMVRATGIQTNFLYKETKMTKTFITYRLTNPEK